MEAIDVEAFKPYSMTVLLDGKQLEIAEADAEGRKRLDAWLRSNVPHPLEVIKPRIEGLPTEAVKDIVKDAAAAGLNWPPRVGSLDGFNALMNSDAGNVELLREGLAAAKANGGQTAPHLKAVEPDARRLYVVLERMARHGDAELPAKVVCCILGNVDPDKWPGPQEEAPAGATAPDESDLTPAEE